MNFIKKFHKLFKLFIKGIISLNKKGIKETVNKISFYLYKRKIARRYLTLSEIKNLSYESEYQKNIDFSKYKSNIKAIAFYLPQFHTIPENDKWWGKDFTEWTNTSKTTPRFTGHYQPREPHDDFGYYDLTDVEIIKKQAVLAKQHGIYGFCFYLYWFSGKRLLEKPLDLFLEHPEININFCLCWANENWTRTWDGYNKKILIKQDYTEDDPYKFIDDIKKYIIDKRYIRINGEPIILVYNPGKIPNIKNVFNIWKEYAINSGIGKIKIFICRTFEHTAKSLDIIENVDGEVEFPPHGLTIYNEKRIKGITGSVFDYREIVNKVVSQLNKKDNDNYSLPLYRTPMLGWDNSARRASGWTVYAGYSLKFLYIWVKSIINEAKWKYNDESSFIFINAWNEWAEGAYLEPDKQYGYANINTFSQAIFGFPFINELSLKKKKNIIFVINDAVSDEEQILSINIIKQLKELFEYNIYTIIKNTGEMFDDYIFYSTDILILEGRNKEEIKSWILNTNADTAICNNVLVGDILLLLSEYKIKCISLIYEMEKTIREYKCEDKFKIIINNASKIIFPSNYVRKSNESIMQIPDEKTVIYPQGLYAKNHYLNKRNEMRTYIRSKFKIPQNSKIVMSAGIGCYRKGIDLFIKCMLKVCKKCNNVYFIWVGQIEKYMDMKLNSILNGNGINNNFINIGYEKDVMPYYAAADIFLLTSREDPFPSAVMEAMFSYLPVIAFENGGGYVEIVNNNSGGLVPMENVESMSEFTMRLLYDDNLRFKMGNYAHNLINEKYNFTTYIYFLIELLDMVTIKSA